MRYICDRWMCAITQGKMVERHDVSAIAETYLKYVTRHYDDSNATIVFVGYDNESTKGHEHLWGHSVPQSDTVNINA